MQDKKENNVIDWENISNNKIKENLMSLRHEHIALKDQTDKILKKIEEVEKEYYYGNSILIKRLKGVE